MAETSGRRRTLGIKGDEVTMYNFTINNNWLKVSKLVMRLTFLVLAAEEIDTIENSLALLAKI